MNAYKKERVRKTLLSQLVRRKITVFEDRLIKKAKLARKINTPIRFTGLGESECCASLAA